VWGNAPAGSRVHPDRISHAFTEARRLAGIPDVSPDGKGAPTFHEIRSLAKRLYDKQGGVDTKALLGHSTDKMGALYGDPRGVEPIRVSVG
jgi:integrase